LVDGCSDPWAMRTRFGWQTPPGPHGLPGIPHVRTVARCLVSLVSTVLSTMVSNPPCSAGSSEGHPGRRCVVWWNSAESSGSRCSNTGIGSVTCTTDRPGAVLVMASVVSLHEPLVGRMFRRRKFDVADCRSILDVGSGAGQILGHLLKRSHSETRLVAFDLSHRMLRRARTRACTAIAPSYVAGDLTQLPFADNSFGLHYLRLGDRAFARSAPRIAGVFPRAPARRAAVPAGDRRYTPGTRCQPDVEMPHLQPPRIAHGVRRGRFAVARSVLVHPHSPLSENGRDSRGSAKAAGARLAGRDVPVAPSLSRDRRSSSRGGGLEHGGRRSAAGNGAAGGSVYLAGGTAGEKATLSLGYFQRLETGRFSGNPPRSAGCPPALRRGGRSSTIGN
jgi:SAM-dependent methyltransferase